MRKNFVCQEVLTRVKTNRKIVNKRMPTYSVVLLVVLLGFETFSACAGGENKPSPEIITLLEKNYPVEWLLDEGFERDDWEQRWTIESQGSAVRSNNGSLQVRRNGVERDHGGTTIWYNEPLPRDLIILIDASTEAGDHACNLNFFVHATESDGNPLRFGRSGDYPEYHEIPNYLFTLTGGFQSGWSRARRNPGFNLVLEDSTTRSEPDRKYQLTIIILDGTIQFQLDGILIHEYEDPDPLPGGHFGLRTWFSDVNYDRVRIARIIEQAD